MKLILDLPIAPNRVLNYKTPVLSLGSCFADRIAQKLIESRFDVLVNPRGILYNPISLANVLSQYDGVGVEDSDLVYDQGLWHSWQHHGQVSRVSKANIIETITNGNNAVMQILSQPKATMFITFGSAWVYTYDDKIVANCHKLPANQFQKRLLNTEEVVKAFSPIIEQYNNHDFVFTVSPVRYSKEGLHNGTLSKAVLHLAVDALVQNFDHAHYFPAYEIVTDQLRDYRFYEADLVHPNEIAVDYVWNRFKTAMVDEKSLEMLQEWQKLVQMKSHKLLHPDTDESMKFSLKLGQKSEDFEAKYFDL